MVNNGVLNVNGPAGTAATHKPKILGPVTDPEKYVRPDWWRNIFNSVYLKTDADVVEDINITRKEVDWFTDILNVTPEDRILDLACGQGRHTLELVRRGYQAEGLDRSRFLISRAKNTAKKQGISIKFREGDARKMPYPSDTFDVVLILGNSFGYFETVRDDLRILKEVYRVLKPWGRVLIDVADGEYLRSHFQPRSWEWIDKKMFVCRERSLSADQHRLISREVITDVHKGVIADQFYAERLYTVEELSRLLETAGISDVNDNGTLVPDSVRNQDLGMMERRIIMTGRVRKEWTPVKRRASEERRKVVVVMGDPTKTDPTKPRSVFDEDDFYTIDQMKAALKSLEEYEFIYLNDHTALINDLRKSEPKIDLVFNLCDEGFGNDPRKELHIPALLEMEKLPYTGSAPQCLAYCYDKSLVRGIAKEMNIPVPKACFIQPENFTFELPFGFPIIVKPNFGDSSFGITQRSVVQTLEELINAISEIRETFGYDKPILVEEFLTGKDLSIGIIGNPESFYQVLPIIEEDYSALPQNFPRVCGYEAKWLPDSPYWNIQSIPAELPEETEKCIHEWSMKLFDRLECRDYARLDWRLDARGNPRLLEVNPNPGWCWDGHLAKMANYGGKSYAEMLKSILQAAEQRLDVRKLARHIATIQ